MSKRRVIGTLIVRHGIVVQSIGFRRYLPVGRPEIAARFFDEWGVDEIQLFDIEARREGRLISTDLVARVSQAIHAPLTVGGGIRSVEDVRAVIANGADKACVNGLLLENLGEVRRIGESFGVQCIVGCMDVRRDTDDTLTVRADGDRRATPFGPEELAKLAAEAGVGEILVHAIHRDGQRIGYDLDLLARVADAVDVPVIALGGAGHPAHLLAALEKTAVSAVAAANFLHYTEHSIAALKSYLRSHGGDIRLDSQADYQHLSFGGDGRIERRNEEDLLDEVFEYIPKEVI